MRRQVRDGLHETNSSSTHSMYVAPKYKGELPDKVVFGHGEFGWEFDEYSDTETLAAYLHEAIHSCYYEDKEVNEVKRRIIDMLADVGVEAEFKEDEYATYSSGDKYYRSGYIDHGYNTIDFVKYVCSTPNHLISYLFGGSYVFTGNDNQRRELPTVCDKDYVEFYKGN